MFVGMRNCQLRPITAGIYGSLKRASFNNRPMQMYNQKHDSGGINNEANVNGLETVTKQHTAISEFSPINVYYLNGNAFVVLANARGVDSPI